MESLVNAGVRQIICVDDCSAERPTFLEKYPVKVVYREKNGGLSVARNDGLQYVSEAYVAFVDSDDSVEPETYVRAVEVLERSGADIALFGVRTIWVEEGLAKVNLPRRKEGGLLAVSEVKELSDNCLFNYAWNKVYRRSFLVNHKLTFDPDGMPCEDVIFNLQCVMSGAKWCAIDYIGYNYFRTGMTLLSKYKPSNLKGLQHGSDAWKTYKASTPEAKSLLGGRGELDESGIAEAEKRNRLKPGSPYWLSGPYNFLRKLCYVCPVRRWRIKRMYPEAAEWIQK